MRKAKEALDNPIWMFTCILPSSTAISVLKKSYKLTYTDIVNIVRADRYQETLNSVEQKSPSNPCIRWMATRRSTDKTMALQHRARTWANLFATIGLSGF